MVAVRARAGGGLAALLLTGVVLGCSSGVVPPSGAADAAVAPDAVPDDPCAASDLDGDGFGTHTSCVVQDCDDDAFGVHPGAPEACNGLDEDCDDEVDEDLGDSYCGVGACRRLLPNCTDGRPTACVPQGTNAPETCNGIDDDCDGETDEGLTGERCGVGACARTATCEAGGWQACVPGAPAEEACNGLDDDCDGVVDEGFEVRVEQGSYLALANHHDVCNGNLQRMGPECNAAIHRHCQASGCGTSGFGPLENSGDAAFVACIAGAPREVAFSDLAARHPGCTGAGLIVSPDCNAAIHRWCSGNGFATGFGPVEHGGGQALIVCLPGSIGAVVHTSYSALVGHHPGCTAQTRWGSDCNAAINRFCAGRGFRTGFGPLENSGDVAVVGCVGTR